jgi:hypothetical protein
MAMTPDDLDREWLAAVERDDASDDRHLRAMTRADAGLARLEAATRELIADGVTADEGYDALVERFGLPYVALYLGIWQRRQLNPRWPSEARQEGVRL